MTFEIIHVECAECGHGVMWARIDGPDHAMHVCEVPARWIPVPPEDSE